MAAISTPVAVAAFVVLIFSCWLTTYSCAALTSYATSGFGHKDNIEITTVKKPKSPSRTAFQLPSIRPDFVPTFEANRHYSRMQERTKCRLPRPVVIEVQRYYTNASVQYLPHCTIIHRCDNEAGCCGNGRTCAALTKHSVDLYFYTTPVDKHRRDGGDVIKLTFMNHSSCACEEDLSTMLERNESVFGGGGRSTPAARRRTASTTEAATVVDEFDDDGDDLEFEHSCRRCPDPFAIRVLDGQQCTCDCFDRDQRCIAIKRGRERMAHASARCVARGDCEVPTCSTGSFDPDRGRCPFVPGKGGKHKRRHNHFNHHRDYKHTSHQDQ